MLHLYAITDRVRKRLPDVRGLDEAQLERLVERGIGAVFTSHRSRIDASEDALWRHEAVVESLMADRTVLPVRFGTSFVDERDLRRAVREGHGRFTEALDEVRGRVELGLRVLWNPRDSGDPSPDRASDGERTSGRAYLAARLAEQKRALELANGVHEPLARVAVASRRRLLVTPRLLLTAAYLVETGEVDAFTETLSRVRAAHPALSVLCTGPWPPYSFVDKRPQG